MKKSIKKNILIELRLWGRYNIDEISLFSEDFQLVMSLYGDVYTKWNEVDKKLELFY